MTSVPVAKGGNVMEERRFSGNPNSQCWQSKKPFQPVNGGVFKQLFIGWF